MRKNYVIAKATKSRVSIMMYHQMKDAYCPLSLYYLNPQTQRVLIIQLQLFFTHQSNLET